MAKPDAAIAASAQVLPVWGRADTVLWWYFFLPVFLFIPGFFVAAISLPVTLAAAAAAFYWLQGQADAPHWSPQARRQALLSYSLLAAVAAVWTMLGGAGHVFYANSFDWIPRFAVLRDLVVQDWPPRYDDGGGRELILRAPLGYYLPVASMARVVGLAWADTILLLWTWLGVSLFFVANFGGTPLQRVAGTLLFASASGLDVLGVWQISGTTPWLGGHIEWWAGRFQYSSNTTLLFWVPNHALPAWIAAAWLWRFRDDSRFVSRLPILFLPVMLWSPLPAIGLLPLASVVACMQWYRSDVRWAELVKSIVLGAPAAGLIATYLLMSADSIPVGVSNLPLGSAGAKAGFDIGGTVLFVLLEVGLVGMLALYRDRSPLFVAALAVLALLPWFRFGPNNDLAMRGSIPALTILWLVLIAELTAMQVQRRLTRSLRSLLVCFWLLGMVTPFQEVYRALVRKPWAPDTTLTAPAALRGFPTHYFAPLDGSVLRLVFRN